MSIETDGDEGKMSRGCRMMRAPSLDHDSNWGPIPK
jgi:hypothetical protein